MHDTIHTVHMHTYVHTHTYTRTHMRTHMRAHTYTHTHTGAHTYTCAHTQNCRVWFFSTFIFPHRLGGPGYRLRPSTSNSWLSMTLRWWACLIMNACWVVHGVCWCVCW